MNQQRSLKNTQKRRTEKLVKKMCKPLRYTKWEKDAAALTLTVVTGRRWVVSFTRRPLYPQEGTPVPIQQNGLAPEPVWTVLNKIFFSPCQDSNPGPSNPQSVRYPTTLSRLLLEYTFSYKKNRGARGGVVVKALRYKPTGRGFDSRLCHWNSSVT